METAHDELAVARGQLAIVRLYDPYQHALPRPLQIIARAHHASATRARIKDSLSPSLSLSLKSRTVRKDTNPDRSPKHAGDLWWALARVPRREFRRIPSNF